MDSLTCSSLDSFRPAGRAHAPKRSNDPYHWRPSLKNNRRARGCNLPQLYHSNICKVMGQEFAAASSTAHPPKTVGYGWGTITCALTYLGVAQCNATEGMSAADHGRSRSTTAVDIASINFEDKTRQSSRITPHLSMAEGFGRVGNDFHCNRYAGDGGTGSKPRQAASSYVRHPRGSHRTFVGWNNPTTSHNAREYGPHRKAPPSRGTSYLRT